MHDTIEPVQSQSILAQCSSGGCGAKIPANLLHELLQTIPRIEEPKLKVGYTRSDDAAAYALSDKQLLLSTVDFFSPMVEDPYVFGQIAAANALSDIYAMGGEPILALNLLCFPQRQDPEILQKILAGGADKLNEAGVSLGGGHSIYDHEIKYGLSVNGLVKPTQLLRNSNAQVGDYLILTKALGVGLILAATRAGEGCAAALDAAVASMIRLNRNSADCLRGKKIHACTDVTGFGLLGHLYELCGDERSAVLDVSRLPILPYAEGYANEYFLTAAGQRNRESFIGKGTLAALSFAMQELLFDPQTSGGLLIAVAEEDAVLLLQELRRTEAEATIIGRVLPRQTEAILFEEVCL